MIDKPTFGGTVPLCLVLACLCFLHQKARADEPLLPTNNEPSVGEYDDVSAGKTDSASDAVRANDIEESDGWFIDERLRDESFSRYVNLRLLGEAIAARDPALLTDIALQMRRGEQILFRSHKSSITSDQLLAKAIRLAVATRDKPTLERLEALASSFGNAELKEVLKTEKLSGASRSTDFRLHVSIEDIDLSELTATKGMLDSVREAEFLGDLALLERLQVQMLDVSDISDEHKNAIKDAIDRAIKSIPSDESQPAAALSKLASASRVPPEQILEGALSGAVERALYHELRDLRSEFSNKWGHTVRAAAGTTTEKYKIYGPRNPFTGKRTWTWGYRPAIRYEQKNHGEWSRGWVRMENAADELDVKFRNFRKTPGKLELRFQIYVRSMFRGQMEFRSYSHGAQLASVTANGRARGHIYLNMRVYIYDNGTRLGWESENTDIKYSDVVVDRVGHLGGTAARLVGDAFTGAIRRWFTDKEREAIAKAERAVSKVISDNRGIRNDIARVIRMIPDQRSIRH